MFNLNLDAFKNENLIEIRACLPSMIFLAQSQKELDEIIQYRKNYYQEDTKEVRAFHDDGLDRYSYVFYSRDSDGKIDSSVRLLIDTEKGFPEESLLPELVHNDRKDGKKIAELGRLLITGDKSKLLSILYKSIFDTAKILSLDYILVVMKKDNYSSHKKIIPVEIISNEMGKSWDKEKKDLCLVKWNFNIPSKRFDRFSQRYLKSDFNPELWSDYSKYHLGVFLSVQFEVYNVVSSKSYGHVLDLGCGSGKMMGFIQENLNTKSYTGVDYSKGMIDLAIQYKDSLHYENSELLLDRIENIEGNYNTIISNLSYYSWEDKQNCLKNIKKSLLNDGTFILVTPNNHFDVPKLSRLVQKEAFGHPYLDEFLSINYNIANSVNYPSLDELISEVRDAGFLVESAHNQFFLGGVSCLELKKAS
jgi:SAM-dependent methyltransferase